jgi:hypothetical protein
MVRHDVTKHLSNLEIQTSSKYDCVTVGHQSIYSTKWQTLTVSLDFHLSLFHFLHQHGISDDTSSIADFSAGFVEPSNDAHDCPLRYVSESRQLVEGLKQAINI